MFCRRMSTMKAQRGRSRAMYRAVSDRLEGLYDITSFEWVSILDVAKTIAAQCGAKIETGTQVGSTPITPIRGRVPGWLPQVPLERGLRQMVDELRLRRAAKKQP